MRKKRQPQPPRAAHPSLATLRPRGWPRPRAPATGPPGVGSPPAPASDLARHLAPRPRLRFSATPPINAPRAAPTLAAAAASSSSRPPVDMAGVSGKRRSPSGDGMFAPRPQLVTRKRRSGGRVRRPPATRPADVLDLNRAVLDPDHQMTGLRVVLQKELRNSDISQLGRIILPKKEAEAYLPNLTSKEGRSLCMHDLLNAELWTFKYRYWPNNKSRMYVLENTGSYVRTHNLRVGDFIMIYRDDDKNRFVIRAKKAGDDQLATVPLQLDEHISDILPIPEIDDYMSLIPSASDISAFLPQADENYEIFDGILNSLPEIPAANVRYSDFFDPFTDCMDMSNPGLNANTSVNLTTHFHDERAGLSLFPNSKSGPLM
ncbi:B3 domain-containing protein LFL1-like [Lolium rigidum]|uniref:B3 domain-containing protein LFL1-like n=1 Tax=Lolium rigidum TaxID=89674 RepID=UPI001F5DAC5B|nr:B3 domain-containing protein LFL1-like [Lolium rigidum]